ncbi:MAG: fibronectin type III domain-containing protein [Flavobacterium sp.]|uniref:fibronectin type III domain-containing protein n=1 Tax=Flavobacterium sp. TaxID=239 RepID=UPI003919B656
MIKKIPREKANFNSKKKTWTTQLTLLVFLFFLLGNFRTNGQCSNYQVYESFNGSSIPSSGGTWAETSITFGTTFPRTGNNSIVFNAANDAIRTPLISNPGIFSFWYRRNNNTTSHSFAIQTSPDGTTWTTRGTTTTPTEVYQQYTIDIGALGLTNIYIRILDTRASGTHNRIVDDISWTSTVASNNTLIPSLTSCSQTITCGTTYTFTDAGGQNDTYNISTDYTITFTPSVSTNKIQMVFSAFATENNYDGMVIYNGPNTSSPIIASALPAGTSAVNCPAGSFYGTTSPGTITSTDTSGAITIRFRSDGSTNLAGWIASVSCITIPSCVAPSSQASAFTLGTITSGAVPATFSGTANGYLVIRSNSSTPPSQPVNGTTYSAANIATLGSGLTFVQSGTSTSIAGTGLTGNTQYYYFIYAYNNTSCSGGPVYNSSGPLVGNGTTCPAVPNSVNTSGITSNSFTLNWAYPTGGTSGTVTYSIQVTTDAGYTSNISGSPFGISAPTTSLNVTGLSVGTTYYYRILAGNGCNSSYITGSVLIPVANDNCSGATSLTVNPNTTCTVTTTGSSVGATQSQAGCAGTADDDVWYSFVATSTSHIVTATPGTISDIVLQVFSGSCGSLTSLACIDATVSTPETTTLTGLTPGNTYYVRIYSYGSSSGQGTFTICVTTQTPCIAPSSQASGLVIGTVTSSDIPASFTGSADGYLVIRSTSSTPPSTPVNGVIYSAANVATLGAGLTFVQTGSSTSITGSGLNGNTQYYYYIYAYNNTNCSGGPIYNSGTPLSGSAVTCPTAPNPVTVTGTTTNSFTLNWTTPTGGGYAPITYSIQITTDTDYTTNIPGSPFSLSSPTTSLNVTGLNPSSTYYYRILANNGCNSPYSSGNTTTTLTNDECSSAIPLSISSTCNYSYYSNNGATASSGVPAPGCASYSGGDVWFSAVVPANGIIEIDTDDSVMTDSGMAIYSGSCGSLTLIECDDDDSANGLMSYITRSGLTPGSTIYIRVWEYGNDNNGSFGICVSSPVPPINDDPCGAIDLNVNTSCSYQSFSTSGATPTTAVTAPSCGNYLGGDVWFSATVPSNGIIRIDTNSNAITDGSLAVYTGNCGSLSLLQCDADSSNNGLMPYLNLTGLTPGSTIYIRFWESGNDVFGTFSICLSTDCTSGNGSGTLTTACPDILAGGLGLSGSDPSPITCSSSTCVDLEAEYLQLGDTSNYTVESIPYNPPYQFSCLANPVSVNVDDVWSPVVNLPFNFCFYGSNYNQCVIGSNGVLTFNTSYASTSSGYAFNDNIPNNTDDQLVGNAIFGVFHDIDPSEGGEVGWELVTLDTGCRALVASWYNVPMFSDNSILYTGMMVLYEETNIIDVYVKEKKIDNNNVSPWNNGNAIIGLQNATRTQAVVAPNRNGLSTNWNATNEAWRFTPAGTSITSIKWYEGSGTSGTMLGSTDTINVCPASTTTYTAEVTYNMCSGAVVKVLDETTVVVSNAKIWNGTVDNDWNKNNNWTPSGIPNNTDCVKIPVTANNPVISGTNYVGYAGSLLVYNGASLTINSNNAIAVTDWVNVETGGTFLINNNASLVQINNTTNTGNIIYKRNASIRKLDYVYWSSPVANYVINNIAAPLSFGAIYKWNTTVANSNGGQGNWNPASGDIMTAGKGYIASAPNSFSATTNTTFYGSFTGVPHNGPITIGISRGSDTNTAYHVGLNGTEINNYSDNWNLLGNPYPSAIRASQFLFDNNTKIMGNVRLWTHGTLPTNISSPFYGSFVYNYSPGDYLTYNFTGTSCCPVAGADLFIGSGQGFFVQMVDGPTASDNVTFNNNLRSTSYTNSNFYRLANSNATESYVDSIERNRIWLDIVNSSNRSDRTLFGYIQDATMAEDNFFDCLTQNTGDLRIYSLINDKKYIIQGRSLPFDVNDEVPIGINVPTTGSYSIGLAAVDGLFDQQNIYLKDLLLNTIHDLKAAPYQFTASAGNYNDRFRVVYLTAALGNNDFDYNNEVKVMTNESLSVSSSHQIIESVIVYNVLGQELARYENVNNTGLTLSNVRKNNTTLLLKITLDNGITTFRKVIY